MTATDNHDDRDREPTPPDHPAFCSEDWCLVHPVFDEDDKGRVRSWTGFHRSRVFPVTNHCGELIECAAAASQADQEDARRFGVHVLQVGVHVLRRDLDGGDQSYSFLSATEAREYAAALLRAADDADEEDPMERLGLV